jgi:CRP-like cAMP-binding protein
MVSPLALQLESFTRLSSEDRAAIARVSRSARDVPPRRDLIREGEKPRAAHLVLSGFGCRYKTLPDGRRQIVSFVLPGDFCDLNSYVLASMDYNIGAVTRMRVAVIGREDTDSLTDGNCRIGLALKWEQLVHESIQREWTLNIGQRTAYERIAHLLVEIFFRLRAVGLTHDDSCDFPITQSDIADATGLTAVHVNRTLQELRRDGCIELEHKRLRIPDLERMMDVAMFNPNYLHLDHEGRDLDATD